MKEGVVRYTKAVKKLFVIWSVFAIPAIMICLFFAFMGYAAFWFISPAAIVVYLFVYGVYALKVSLSVALGVQTTKEVVHIYTKRKTFTYDIRMGCVEMKKLKNKYVGVFQTQDSREKFVFYRRAPFGKYSEEQFTEAEIDLIRGRTEIS